MITRKHKSEPLTLTKKQIESIQKKDKINESNESNEKIKGLGDVVEKVAKPIAKVIDAVANTNIQGCGGCAKRRKYLNDKFPLN